jgi:CBS domain-containing protein
MTASKPVQRSYLGPAFADAKVYDAMHVGVVTCGPDTSISDAARMMTGYGIHCLIVADVDPDGRIHHRGVIDALEVAAAASDARARTVAEIATTELLTIESNARLEEAARLMAEHRQTHLVAVQPGSDRPVGVISASGLMAVLAWGRS